MSRSFLVELSRLGPGDPMSQSDKPLERDRQRFLLCRGLEDLGFSIENSVSMGMLTSNEELVLNSLAETLANKALGVPADALVRITPLSNTFRVLFLF